MAKLRRSGMTNVHEIFADVALLMLATFVFLLVLVLISARFAHDDRVPELEEQVARLKAQLQAVADAEAALQKEVKRLVVTDAQGQLESILTEASVGKKDFDLFVEGLKDLPGDTIHLVVDASGSMHGISNFLVPILRHIVIRAGKRLDALTWFVDNRSETYTGTMGEVLDMLMSQAPFAGNRETIGAAFRSAARNAPPPGAYMLLGDEPSVDSIQYSSIPSPVFTMPLGRSDPRTEAEYGQLAERTGGKMLVLDFK